MRVLGWLSLWLFFCIANAKTEFSPKLAQSYEFLYKLKLDSAQILIRRNEQSEPDNEVNKFMYSYVEFIRILLSEDNLVYSQWQNRFNLRINAFKAIADASPYKQYLLGEMYIKSSILKFKFGDQVGALIDFKKGYSFLASNEKDFPNFPYHKKTLGFIHIVLSYIPNKYKWVLHTFGFGTNFDKGKFQLQAALQNEVATKYEAFFLVQWLNIIFDDKTGESLKAMAEFAKQHPDFVVAKWSLIMALKNENRVEEALEISSQMKPNSGFYFSPYFYFVNGQMQLFRGNYEKSTSEMQLFIVHYKGKMLRQSAFYFMYLSDYLQQKPDKLGMYKDSVLNTPESGSEQDRVAKKVLLENPTPTLEILKARLYYDGGYFDKSLAAIDRLQPNTIADTRESIEYFYRKARLLEKRNDNTNALKFYQLTIKKQGKGAYYFAPNSYLLMAKIVKDDNLDLAKNYLKKIDNYDGYEYQPAIEYQAKALLKKL